MNDRLFQDLYPAHECATVGAREVVAVEPVAHVLTEEIILRQGDREDRVDPRVGEVRERRAARRAAREERQVVEPAGDRELTADRRGERRAR